MIKISIVVGTRDRPVLCEACVTSLLANDYPHREIVIVDQSRDDATERVMQSLAEAHKEIRYTHDDRTGSSRARNLGVALSTGDVLAFTDDDCVAEPDWLSQIARELAETGLVGVVGRILATSHGRSIVPVAIQEHNRRRQHRGARDVWRLGYGPNMAFRREAVEAAGGFDELLGPGARLRGCNDVDLIYRIVCNGGRVVYFPDLVVHHQQWRNWRQILSCERAYALGAGGMIAKYLRRDLGEAATLSLYRLWPFGVGRAPGEIRTVAQRSAWWAVGTRSIYRLYCLAILLQAGWLAGLRHPMCDDHVLYDTRSP